MPCTVTIDGVTDFVLTTRFGGVQNQGTINKALHRIVRTANSDPDAVLLPMFSAHILRHTYCTNMIRGGAELTAVSELMGHRDISTTADIYNDVQRDQKEEAARRGEAYAAGKSGEPGK